MRRFVLLWILIILLGPLFVPGANAQDELRIWKEFVAGLKKGEITADKIRPYHEMLKPADFGYVEQDARNGKLEGV